MLLKEFYKLTLHTYKLSTTYNKTTVNNEKTKFYICDFTPKYTLFDT